MSLLAWLGQDGILSYVVAADTQGRLATFRDGSEAKCFVGHATSVTSFINQTDPEVTVVVRLVAGPTKTDDLVEMPVE